MINRSSDCKKQVKKSQLELKDIKRHGQNTRPKNQKQG